MAKLGLSTIAGAVLLAAVALSPVSAPGAAADFLGVEAEAGTVEVGKRADLLLVDGNPLEDVKALGAIATVVVCGDVLPRR